LDQFKKANVTGNGGVASMLQAIYNWIDERLDITPLWRDVADHEVPEHVNPAHHFSAFIYCFGGLTFFVVVIQILSGMFLAMYYVPDIVNAQPSVKYLQDEIAMGAIVRGMHHWGASVAIVMLFLHTLRVFFTGSYKHPREFNWVVGMLIFFVMLGLGFTGYLLPWDNKAYFATEVGVRIAASVPVVGEYIAIFLRGGDFVGAQTLARFFALHVFFLPAALLGLLGAHFVLIRRQGISGPL
jgi:menaquinol-cytochrome c reductase cytochrome b subunit